MLAGLRVRRPRASRVGALSVRDNMRRMKLFVEIPPLNDKFLRKEHIL
jgi:hypothetical protein